MGKITTKQVFKQYNQGQNLLLPPSLDELIPDNHLVRVVNKVVDRMDIIPIVNSYQGGGTSAYAPAMMVKILLYAYAVKIYTGRKIAKALRQDVTFMWLAAMQKPDFRTINGFRSGILKDAIEGLFKDLLIFLVEEQYVKLENYFSDGTTIIADGNRNKMVWRKNALRYKERAELKCEELFKEIDELNRKEEQQYGKRDLEELGTKPVTDQVIENQVKRLNDTISTSEDKIKHRKAESLSKKLTVQKDKIKKYKRQIDICNQRSGYNRTDIDASALFAKEKQILPAYNVLASCEGQFITAYSVHQNPNDATCFKEHLSRMQEQNPDLPKNIVGDSIFGTEENYELLQTNNIGNYFKFPTFHKEQTTKFRENPFLKENFIYSSDTNTYTCPNNQTLTYRRTFAEKHSKTGYVFHYDLFECENCKNCPYSMQCKKSEEKNRTIKVNRKLEAFKEQARLNLKSEKGIYLRKQRGMEIESCFGDIKHNMGFRRFHLRGKQKVKTEIGMIAISHNIRKVCLQNQKIGT